MKVKGVIKKEKERKIGTDAIVKEWELNDFVVCLS